MAKTKIQNRESWQEGDLPPEQMLAILGQKIGCKLSRCEFGETNYISPVLE